MHSLMLLSLAAVVVGSSAIDDFEALKAMGVVMGVGAVDEDLEALKGMGDMVGVGAVDYDLEALKAMSCLVSRVNSEMADMQLDVMGTQYLYYDFFLGHLELTDARIGNLSSLELTPGADQKAEGNPEEGYTYHLTLGLTQAFLRFGFNFTLTPWISGSGLLNLTESGLSVAVMGSYKPGGGEGRDCTGHLERVVIRGLGDLSLVISPSSVLRSLISYIGELGLRHSIGWLQEGLNHLLSGSKQSAVVQDVYRILICGK